MRVLNIGVLAHVDAGKTSIVEQLLFATGAIRQLGSVDKGNAQSDWMPLERARGISIRSSQVITSYQDTQINIIDTPGHMDFIGEVERSLIALDAVVLVVSSLEGVQSQTSVFWHALRSLHLPCIIFVNKIDLAGSNPEALLEHLRQELTPYLIPLNTVHFAGLPECSCEDLPLGDNALAVLCDTDETLADLFLNEQDITPEHVRQSLATQTAAGQVVPLLLGSAMRGLAIESLLQAICSWFPTSPASASESPEGVIYRIEHHERLGKLAYVRLFQGKIKPRDSVHVHRPSTVQGNELQHGSASSGLHSEEEGAPRSMAALGELGLSFEQKITQVKRVSGAKYLDIDHVSAGDIAALCGLTDAKTGDVLGDYYLRRSYPLATPVYTIKAHTDASQQTALLHAIAQLTDEDPLLDYMWVKEKQELHVHIMGQIQLEVLQYLLQERYNLSVQFGTPSVIYKETPLTRGIGFEAYTMPKPCWAIVKLQIDPLPRGSGYRYSSTVGLQSLPLRYQNHIEASVPEALQQGRLGWEVTDVHVTLIDGESHLLHTHPLDFFLATPIAVQDGLARCGSQLLEPFVEMRFTADESLVSRIIGDILAMRGEFDTPIMKSQRVELRALLPVADSSDYAIRFASLTSGKGIIQSMFHGYRECSPELGQIAERRGVDPLDRPKWILHRRGAIG